MAYNQVNKLKRYKLIIDIVNKHYDPDFTTYAGIFRKFIEPFYPMNYQTFMRIVNTPGIDQALTRELAKQEKSVEKNQLSLF